MLTRSSQLTLEQVMAVPGIGAQVMSLLPIPYRVRLRRTCRTFLASVDESLLKVNELFGEDMAGDACAPGANGLSWLLTKCPDLKALSTATRAEHAAPWQDRVRVSLWFPWGMPDWTLAGPTSLQQVASRYQGLTDLNVASCRGVKDAGIIAIARACPGLTALDVSDCYVRDRAIIAVAESCRGLVRLAVTDCDWVSDASFEALAAHCHDLEALDANNTDVTDHGVIEVALHCPRLRRLLLSEGVSDDGIASVAQNCPRLEHLGIPHCDDMTDDALMMIAAGCPRLTQLDAIRSGIGDEGLILLAEACAGLRHLDVSWTDVTDAGVCAVAGHCPRLDYLDVSQCEGVTDAGIKSLASKCAGLRSLAVARCHAVTDAGIRAVAESCPGLRALTMRSHSVTGDSLRAIAAHCPDLTYLDMTHCSVSGASLAALAKGCLKLEYLDVTSSGCWTSSAVAAISRHSTRLRMFGAAENFLSEGEVRKLVRERGHNLRELSLSTAVVNDKTVALIAERCPRLQRLVLEYGRLTVKSVRVLAARCKGLRLLNAHGCGLTRADLRVLSKDRCHTSGALDELYSVSSDEESEESDDE
eukprot:jgi/Mesvir1/7887/Mv11820-RA.1